MDSPSCIYIYLYIYIYIDIYIYIHIYNVSIATCYGLDGPRIESRWRRDLLHLSRQALGPTQAPVQWVLGLSWGKADGVWCWPPTPM